MNQCKKLLIENVSYNKNINVRSSSFFWLAKEVYIQNQKNDFQSLSHKLYNFNKNDVSKISEKLYGYEMNMECFPGASCDYSSKRTEYNVVIEKYKPKNCSSKK